MTQEKFAAANAADHRSVQAETSLTSDGQVRTDPQAPRPNETGRMLQTLLGNLDGMVYRCRDDEKWTMEFVSEGCVRLTGYDADDLLLNNRVSYEVDHASRRPRSRP